MSIISNFFLLFLSINLIILLIKPIYPQKKPDLTASFVFLPTTAFIFLSLIGFMRDAFVNKDSNDNFTPGDIRPP